MKYTYNIFLKYRLIEFFSKLSEKINHNVSCSVIILYPFLLEVNAYVAEIKCFYYITLNSLVALSFLLCDGGVKSSSDVASLDSWSSSSPSGYVFLILMLIFISQLFSFCMKSSKPCFHFLINIYIFLSSKYSLWFFLKYLYVDAFLWRVVLYSYDISLMICFAMNEKKN